MKPIRTAAATSTFELAAAEHGDLPCGVDKAGTVTSWWEVTADQRESLIRRRLAAGLDDVRIRIWQAASEVVAELEVHIGRDEIAPQITQRSADGAWRHYYRVTGRSLIWLRRGEPLEVQVSVIPPPPMAIDLLVP